MKTLLSVFCAALLGVFSLAISSFSQDLSFNLVPPPKGLYPGTNAGVQDLQGYMWIGAFQSAPLRRYDGYSNTLYSNDPLDSNSLAGNWTISLCADSKGFIWIGTAGYGLDRLDPTTGNFEHFRSNPKDPNSLSNDMVLSILEDRDGILWIGTERGLNRYDPNTGKFTRYYHQPNDPYSLSCNQVEKIYEDRQGRLWVGTGGIWTGAGGETDEGGLNRFDKKANKFIRYIHEPLNPRSLINNKVKAIFEDSRGTFWVGTAGDGLHTMDRDQGTFQRHLYDPVRPKNLSRPPQKKIRVRADDHITFIIEDATGSIWIGTFGNGLNRYDPETKQVTHYPNIDPVSGADLEVAAWACSTRDGMLWIGYWRGLYRIDPLRKNIPYFATGAPVTQIYKDKVGVLWYGTDEGLVRKDVDSGIEQRYVHDPRNHRTLSNNHIAAIYEDRQGVLWIGTWNGLNSFDRKTETFIRHPLILGNDSSSLVNKGVYPIHEDREGFFWFGIDGAGLIRKKPQANTFTHYLHNPQDTNSFSNATAYRIYEDNHNNLWIGNWVGGLDRFVPQTGKFQHFLGQANIHNLCQDSDGILWVATSTGLYRSNQEMTAFSRFSGPNAEFAENVVVNGVLEDNHKALWINSSLGICRLSPQRNELVTFSRNEDLIFLNGTGCYKGTNGELFFGGSSGYFMIPPAQIKSNPKPPQIVLSAFRIGGQSIMPGEQGPLKAPLAQVEEIRLQHNQDAFSFDFAGIHYSSPENNRHFFMLENLDNAWRKAGEEKTAYYYNVPPGEYVFRVKASNSDGVWAEKAVTVVISPPWWLTSWAYVAYVILGVSLLYALRQYTLRRERLKHELRFQRMEAEKMHEIDKMKSHFFANISHEFRTPLTLILGPLEKFLSREVDQDKPIYQAMQRNAKRLLNLVNQLLDLSKLEEGNMRLETRPAAIFAFLKAIVFSFTSLAERKQIQYHFQYPTDNPVVYFDADKLEKIISNLLSNAFKFTPEGGNVTISVRLLPAKDQRLTSPISINDKQLPKLKTLELSVKDNGMGIPKDQLAKVFDRFYQTDNSHTGKPEGSGIGLALVRELVELHAGEIVVESESGEGTCFTVRLPLAVADLEETVIAENTLDKSQQSLASFEDGGYELRNSSEPVSEGVPLILIVEDNADIRHFIRENLHPEYKVIEAADGEAGYSLALEHIPDLILSDVMMPKMDGVELCRKLKEDKRTDHIPVILLTAKASGESKIEGLETGADDYIIKPFEASELLVRIKNLIEGRRKLRERFSREITLEPASISISSRDEKLLSHIKQIVEEHMSDPDFGLDSFCMQSGMSRSQLHRKLKALTDQSPGDFIRIMRLKRAAELLNNQVGSIGEVAFMVGFNDPSYFTKCFQKQFGRTPSEFIMQS